MREVMYALESISDRTVIENFIKRQDFDGCALLINVLRYTEADTERRWLTVYSELLKY